MNLVNERNLNPAVADYVKGKKTKLIKVKVANLDDEAIDDRFGRVIDTDPDVGVDLDDPILLDKDGKTILDGFHRVYQAKRIGREFIPAEKIIENKMEFKLIDTEISEARLYRTTSGFNQLTGEAISELLYLNTLITYMMYKDKKQSKFAQSYAKQTIQYGKYTLFRSHATDLYLLANVVSNPDSNTVSRLRQPGKSERYLKSLKFDKRTHWTFMMNIANGRANDVMASPYMFRLESQLKIKKSMYKQWRRLIMDWENLKYNQKQYVVTKIAQELRRLGRGSEVLTPVSHMIKYRSYKTNDKFKKNTGRKIAGAVAGGVAGRYAGKKIAQKLGKDVDKYKKVGTGLGAIAGYWAGGRSRQI